MKLLFKQRLFSWFDSYDIYDAQGGVFCTVKGQLSWGHCLNVYDSRGSRIGTVKERVLTILPKFEIYIGGTYRGCIRKELTLLRPRYNIDFNGWQVQGSILEWDYTICDQSGRQVAAVSKQLFRLTDTYVIDVNDPNDALYSLMLVLAIDAEKCSRGDD